VTQSLQPLTLPALLQRVVHRRCQLRHPPLQARHLQITGHAFGGGASHAVWRRDNLWSPRQASQILEHSSASYCHHHQHHHHQPGGRTCWTSRSFSARRASSAAPTTPHITTVSTRDGTQTCKRSQSLHLFVCRTQSSLAIVTAWLTYPWHVPRFRPSPSSAAPPASRAPPRCSSEASPAATIAKGASQ
jgi:hypothetical protein